VPKEYLIWNDNVRVYVITDYDDIVEGVVKVIEKLYGKVKVKKVHTR